MNVHVKPEQDGYGILIEQLTGTVTLRHNGVVLAQSDKAKVMYETRLKPTIYFPPEDVIADLSTRTPLQTFCPFKGTAIYRDLLLPDAPIKNATWAYETALPEASAIKGHIGFMPNAFTDLDLGDNEILARDTTNISGPVIDWLLLDAAYLPTPEDFTAALAEKLREQGVYLSRMAVMVWSLHPMIAGKNFVWKKSTGEVTTFAPSYEIHDHPSYQNSPLRHVSNGLGGVRHRLGGNHPTDAFPILEDLRKEGATDYVAMPLRFSDGSINVLTLTSDHPTGFSTANLGLIFECSAVIGRYYEVFMQRENAQSLLETYVGKRSAARVLGGEIHRGDGDDIDAAIMFCDLRGSTLLEEKLGRVAYITLLNQFFETTSTIIHDHGGEVLKFIGDAVLAVFPADENPAEARAQALNSARAIVARLEELALEEDGHRFECAIGIAYGDVTYGNVGSQERLDFTVIGQAANIAARLGDYGKSRDHPIVVSRDILSDQTAATSLGAVNLHNVSQPVESFAISVP
ncbi:MAG: guanylate cyclase [Rhodobacteraceae bacterium]|nr:MAG: guanylate cyclase [Paracoccaceae bacterium]